MKKILWVKFGWSEFYRGGPVDGNFSYMLDGSKGHEAWNFEPAPDGRYYCYVPPQGRQASKPSNDDPHGWTVVCLAKNPKQKGVHVVGWYEDATLEGQYLRRPGAEDSGEVTQDGWGKGISYSISAPIAHLVPPDARTHPFSHLSIKQGKYSLLDGPNVPQTENKRQAQKLIERELRRLAGVAVTNPNTRSAPDTENDETDPLRGFGTPEHRKEVEEKAVAAAKKALKAIGYSCISRERENVGFDLEATHAKNGGKLHVEVKGTSGSAPRFFMTANEHGYREAAEWRLAMVTDALGKPSVDIYTLAEFEKKFELLPMVWKGVKRASA